MAVEVVYRSSRDQERLFMDKAEADRYDKMLELAETLAEVPTRAPGRKSPRPAAAGCNAADATCAWVATP